MIYTCMYTKDSEQHIILQRGEKHAVSYLAVFNFEELKPGQTVSLSSSEFRCFGRHGRTISITSELYTCNEVRYLSLNSTN